MPVEVEYKALKKFVMKGIGSKEQIREAADELQELVEGLQEILGELEDALGTWEDMDEDAETRAEAKVTIEELGNNLDNPLTQAGLAAGCTPYEVP